MVWRVERPGDRVVVVDDFERAEVVGTEIEGFLGIELAAESTLQAADEFFGHRRFSCDTGDSRHCRIGPATTNDERPSSIGCAGPIERRREGRSEEGEARR